MPDKKVVDEVKAAPASTDPKSLQNGLGLEKLFVQKPSTTVVKAPVKADAVKVTEDEKKPDPAPKKVAVKTETPKEEKPADLDSLSKQLKDTRDYATQVNQKNKDLERSHAALLAEMAVIKQKLDGTYVDPPQPSNADQKFMGRVEADDAIMKEQYGVDVIQQLIWDADSPYMKLEVIDPAIRERVNRATRPVYEAYKVVEEHQFFEKYGRDPEKIKQALIAEAEEKAVNELKGEMRGKTGDSIQTLSKVNGVPRDAEPKNPNGGSLNIKSIFPNFQPTTNR